MKQPNETFAMTDPMRAGQAAWRGVAVLLVVFVAGAVTGAATTRYYQAHSGLTPLLGVNERADRGTGDPRVTQRAERLADRARMNPEERRAVETGIPTPMFRLDLTPQQEAALTEIARRRRPAAESLMASLRPTVRKIENQMMQEMLCALTPPQQAHWLAYMDTARFEPGVVAERYRPVRTGTCEETRR